MPIRPFDLKRNISPNAIDAASPSGTKSKDESNLNLSFSGAAGIPDELNQILIDKGITPKPTNSSNKDEVRNVFNAAGASIDEVARQVSNIMSFGESDSGRLKAAELTLKVHGILQELDDKPIPVINITITNMFNQEDNSKTLINLILPTPLVT